MNPVQATLASFLRQGVFGISPASPASPALPLVGNGVKFQALLGDLLTLLEGVGETAGRVPVRAESESAPPPVDVESTVREAADPRAPEVAPPRDEEETEPESDPVVEGDVYAPAAPIVRPDPIERDAPPVLRDFGGPVVSVPVGTDPGGGDVAPEHAPPVRAELPVSDRSAVTGFEVVAPPEEGAPPPAPERVLPRLAPPREVPEPLLSSEARVLFDSEGLPPGAEARRGPPPPPVQPHPEPTPPSAAVVEAPPAPPPGLEVALDAVRKSVPPEPSNAFVALERALGLVVEELPASDAGSSSNSGGQTGTPHPGTPPVPAEAIVAPPTEPNAPVRTDASGARIDVGAVRRAGGADATVASNRGLASTSDAGERAEFIDRIVRASQLARRHGETRLQIVLRPPELGRLRVDLSVRDGVLNVRIGADRAGAQELVQQHIGALRESLEQQGVRVGEIQVSVDGEAGGSQPQHHADDRGPSFEDVSGLPSDAFSGEESIPASPRAYESLRSALVDVFA